MEIDRGIFTDDLAERLKARVGQKYRPSNGVEGEMFMFRWCEQCKRDSYENGPCPIVASTMCFDLKDEGYPAEWQYGEDGQPKCTAFDPKES